MSSHKFINKLWTLNLKIKAEIEKNNSEDSSENFSKYTNKFIEKISKNLENFSYNIIIANIHEMHTYLTNEIKNKYTKETLIENYKKILICINPIIPHFSSECLSMFEGKQNYSWPSYDKNILIENEVQIVVQINGKKRGIVKVIRNVEEKDLINILKKDIKIKKYIIEKEIKRQIYIKDKLINIIL